MNKPSLLKKIILLLMALVGFSFGVYMLVGAIKMVFIVMTISKSYTIGNKLFLILGFFLRFALRMFFVFYLIFPYCYSLLQEVFEN